MPDTLDAEAALKPVLAIGLLEFVDFGETPIESGTTVRTDFDYPYFPQAEGTILHTIMANDGLKEITVTTDQVGRPAVSFTLTAEGTKIFADFTTSNIGRYLGIVLDKVVVSSPVINAPITDGQAMIQGTFTTEEANALVAYLRTKGPLPWPLVIKQVIKAHSQ